MIGKKKIKVAILMGGVSNEREVSLSTGKTVAQYMNLNKFIVSLYDTKKDLPKLFFDISKNKIDICFIALHGKGGEDGSIQGMLELLNVPYTGPGIMASAVSMDKITSKRLFMQEKILTPKFIIVGNQKINSKEIINKVGLPCVTKPSNSGSSVGISIIKNKKDIKRGIKKAWKEDNKVIIEEYIKGKEITVGVLGNEDIRALPIVENIPKTKFFDFQAKYDAKFCEEISPARIPAKITKKAQELALKVYKLLDCKGFSRIDMILKKDKIYVLENNTIPGLTPNSLLPKAAKADNISFSKLLEKIINFGLKNEAL